MAEGISNNTESYKFQNPQLQKYDTDGDGGLSIFEIENISDESGINLLYEELSAYENNITNQDVETQVQSLEAQLQSVKDEQGAISSLWNGLKCLTGIGSSTNKCEKAIEQFKNGEISYEEASSIISGFQSKQKSSVNLISNIATGVAAVLVVGSAVATGGLSLGVVAAAAGVGAATKAGLKFADRATNKVEGDALDGKQIAKDALSGAVDGAISVATMGIGTAAVTGKTVAQQTLKQTIIQGAKRGALDGAISGAVTGASDYTIEAAFEEDVEFNVEDLAKSTLSNAAGGAIAGGIMGGASSGIQYKKVSASLDDALPSSTTDSPKLLEEPKATTASDLPQDINEQLTKQANDLNAKFAKYSTEAEKQIRDEFGDLSSVETITSRAKGTGSIFEKLANKFKKGTLKSTGTQDCLDAIGDAYGTRVQLKSLTQERSQEIIEKCLKDSNISYEQFISYMNGNVQSFDDATLQALQSMKNNVINSLKEEQTQEIVDQLVNAIKRQDNPLVITELNNYGDEISSYFTTSQLKQISDAYSSVNNGAKLDIVSKLDDDIIGRVYDVDASGNTTYQTDTAIFSSKGATKNSGYTSSQMNTKQVLSDGTIGNGELQIRGTAVNEFADIEHIPYDIRQGKIKADNPIYSDIHNLISKMSESDYKAYNEYLTSVYDWLRLKELGISTNEPLIQAFLGNSDFSSEALELLSRQGLTALKASNY